jgi:hypothetical protein
MQNSKFLGVCVLISSLIVAAAIVYHAKPATTIGRYQFHPHQTPGVFWVLDTTTGEVLTKNPR